MIPNRSQNPLRDVPSRRERLFPAHPSLLPHPWGSSAPSSGVSLLLPGCPQSPPAPSRADQRRPGVMAAFQSDAIRHRIPSPGQRRHPAQRARIPKLKRLSVSSTNTRFGRLPGSAARHGALQRENPLKIPGFTSIPATPTQRPLLGSHLQIPEAEGSALPGIRVRGFFWWV